MLSLTFLWIPQVRETSYLFLLHSKAKPRAGCLCTANLHLHKLKYSSAWSVPKKVELNNNGFFWGHLLLFVSHWSLLNGNDLFQNLKKKKTKKPLTLAPFGVGTVICLIQMMLSETRSYLDSENVTGQLLLCPQTTTKHLTWLWETKLLWYSPSWDVGI